MAREQGKEREGKGERGRATLMRAESYQLAEVARAAQPRASLRTARLLQLWPALRHRHAAR